jgi:hypothetical protein
VQGWNVKALAALLLLVSGCGASAAASFKPERATYSSLERITTDAVEAFGGDLEQIVDAA